MSGVKSLFTELASSCAWNDITCLFAQCLFRWVRATAHHGSRSVKWMPCLSRRFFTKHRPLDFWGHTCTQITFLNPSPQRKQRYVLSTRIQVLLWNSQLLWHFYSFFQCFTVVPLFIQNSITTSSKQQRVIPLLRKSESFSCVVWQLVFLCRGSHSRERTTQTHTLQITHWTEYMVDWLSTHCTEYTVDGLIK